MGTLPFQIHIQTECQLLLGFRTAAVFLVMVVIDIRKSIMYYRDNGFKD